MTRFLCFVVAAAAWLASDSIVLAQHRLITQGNQRLAIVGRDGKIEWEMPWGGIHDIRVLANGNILVQQGAAKVAEIDRTTTKVVWSYDAGEKNPLLIELDPGTKKVVWTFDQFATFGNSVSNSQLLDIDGDVLR